MASYGLPVVGSAIANASGSCILFCANSTYPFAETTTSSNQPQTGLTANKSGQYIFGGRIAFDQGNTYVMSTNRGSYWQNSIKMINSSGVLSEIAGNDSNTSITVSNSPSLSITAGTTLEGNFVGSPQAFNVVSGVIYVLENNTLYTATAGGTWVQQSTATMTSMVVDPASGNIYYVNGTQLYRLVYEALGGATSTLVVDFSGTLVAPAVREFDPNNAHTIYLTDGNSVYKYYNATSIP
jgi:hypothetical protein